MEASPVAADDTAATYMDTPVVTNVLANDIPGNPPTNITAVTQGSNGSVAIDGPAGTTTYTPNAGYIGSDSYTYNITDTDGETSTATVNVTVMETPLLPITFRVFGDVPYSKGEFAGIAADLANLGSSDEFFVHVGDIIAGGGSCNSSAYTNVATSLQTSSVPVFIIPGDNEYNDCSNPNQAWTYWENTFTHFEDNWTHGLNVSHQAIRDENFAFVHGDVLFVGINLVGGTVHDSNEWAQRQADDADWINENFNTYGDQVSRAVIFGHAFPNPNGGPRQQFGQAFVAASQAFSDPVLYMMGDAHSWEHDMPYSQASNVTRVIVDQGVPSVRVTVTADPLTPFVFDRNP